MEQELNLLIRLVGIKGDLGMGYERGRERASDDAVGCGHIFVICDLTGRYALHPF